MGDALRWGVVGDGGELGFDAWIIGGDFSGEAEDFGKIDGGDGDAVAFEDFFGVADGVESAGSCADGAEASAAEAADRAADRGEAGEVGFEGGVGRMDDVAGGESEGDVGLLEVVADGDFSAEGVAAASDAEGVEIVGVALDQDGDVEAGKFDSVGDAFFIAKVGEDDEDAVNDIAVGGEEVGTFAGIGVGFDAAEFGLFGGQHDGVDGGGIEEGFDVFAGFADEDVGEEVSVADDDGEGDGGVACGHGGRGSKGIWFGTT